MITMRNIRAFTLGALLVVFVGVSAYWIKSRAYEKQETLAALEAGIQTEMDRIMVLRNDWSYLTRPDRIRTLSEEMLSFAPVEPQRILDLDHLGNPSDRKAQPAQAGLHRITVNRGAE